MIYFRRISKARHQQVADSFELIFDSIWEAVDHQIEKVMPELKQQDTETIAVYEGVRQIYHDRVFANYRYNVEDAYRHDKGLSDLSIEEIGEGWGEFLRSTIAYEVEYANLPTELMHFICGDKNLERFTRIIKDMKATFAACPDMDSEEIERERQATRKRLAPVWKSLEPWSRSLAADEMLAVRLQPFA